MPALNWEYRPEFTWFNDLKEAWAGFVQWFMALGFYGWLFGAILIAGIITGLVYAVKSAQKTDWKAIFTKDADYLYFIGLAALFLIYFKYPKAFAPLTVLAVFLIMVFICTEYGKEGEKSVNKIVLVAAFVLPILPFIWVILGSSAQWLHLLVMVLYILIVVLLLVINPAEFLGKYNQDTNSVYLVSLIGLFSMVCVFLNQNIFKEPWTAYTGRLGFLLLCLVSVGFSIQYAIRFFMQSPSLSPNYLLMLSILVGFGVLFLVVVVRNLPRPNTFSKSNLVLLMMAVLFCRLQDMLNNNPLVYVILVVELLLILYYVFSRQLYRKVEEGALGTQLVNEPIKLNRATGLTVQGDFKYNYAVSCWVWLMPQPPDESPTSSMFENILDYSGKPRVLYNAALNTLRISMQRPPSEGEDAGAHILMADIPKIPLQRWHNLVLSYNNGTFDIFLNGSLYLSVPSVVPNNMSGELAIGVEKGNRGKLCNLVFYKGGSDPSQSFVKNPDAISAEKVLELYNQFANKSPPIITRILSIAPDPTYANMRV
jgi:hypothetical protein